MMPISNAELLLAEDARERRPWQLYIDNVLLRQANGTNPRIRQVDPIKADQLAIATDRVLGLVYEVRIVKLGINAALILPDKPWGISFDKGATRSPMRLLPPIREGTSQGLYWLAYLEEQRYV